MKYEHTPRPEIEHHYHIRELIEAQEKRTDDRNYHRNRLKAKEDRDEVIRDAKPVEIKEFWCDECGVDFAELVWKQVEVDWSNTTQNIAFYKTKHECGNWCIRFITDRWRDPYWFESTQVSVDRGKYHNALIQPFETGYQLLYGRKNKE